MTADKFRDLKAGNLELFRRRAPDIHARLTAADGAADRPAGKAAGGGGRPAPLLDSVRFTAKAPTPTDLDAHAFHFLQSALRRATDAGIAFFPSPATPHSYFMVVVGAGDGDQLLAALRCTRALCVIVIEPDAGALRRSLDCVDWAAVFDAVDGRGGTLHFLIEGDANRASANVWRAIRKTNPAAADGFTVVTHDHHDLAQRIVRNLGDEAHLIVAGLGFFRDELLMLANAYRNLKAPDARVFKRAFDAERGMPAFVVGSGPSLDWSIGAIAANAGKAVVVSCGSALRPLLKKGIVPDFQIEIENINVSPLTTQAAREHGVKGITLVTACTVDSDAVAAFDDVVYFFRRALSPYPLFCRTDEWSLPLPDPTVTNAGLSFAQAVGFRDIYLFGVDFGSQMPHRHHARDAFHHTAEATYRHVAYDIEVDANFGGTCFTDRNLFAARENMIEAIRVHGTGRRHYNCSDGAAIRGAAPARPQELEFAGPAMDKPTAVANIVAGFESGASLVGAWPGNAIGKAVDDHAGRLTACLAAIEDFTDGSFYLPLMKILRPQTDDRDSGDRAIDAAVTMVFRGSLLAMLTFFEYYLARVADPAHVDRFGAIARDELVGRIEALRRLALAGLGGAAPLPPAGDTATVDAGERLPALKRIGRNAPCPCGSGAKYKHCHGKAG